MLTLRNKQNSLGRKQSTEPRRLAKPASVEFSGNVRELCEVNYLSGAASAASLLTRAKKALMLAQEPVWVWWDTDELTFSSEDVQLVNTIKNVLKERSMAGLETHVRSVTRSLKGGAMNHIVEQATLHARTKLGLLHDELAGENLLLTLNEERVRWVKEAVKDNRETEKLLFNLRHAFEEGLFYGSLEFRGIANQVGSDYLMIGAGTDSKVLSEWLIIRSERCHDTAPFEGVGLSVDPWTLAGAEVERKMSERWHDASENLPMLHSENFVSTSILAWDQGQERLNLELKEGLNISPSLMSAINDVLAVDPFSFDSES